MWAQWMTGLTARRMKLSLFITTNKHTLQSTFMYPFLFFFGFFFTLQHYTHDLFELHIINRLVWLYFYERGFLFHFL